MNQNLPTPLTSLIGRERELAQIESVIRQTSTRLITITGPGGIGKTRIALEITHHLNRHFAAGCAWVSLASVQHPNDVAMALANALGIEVPAGRTAQWALCEELAHRDALLVVDNFEHVTDAAPLLAELLQAGSSLRIIVTSRTILNLSGEHLIAIGPLAIPEPNKDATEVAELAGFSAIRLFVERANAATGSFSLMPENAVDVVTICRALDCLPLAIELAAARLRHLSLAAITARVEGRLQLLVGGPRDRPVRHQTLHEAIDWSYRLLDPRAQALFRRLAALPAGCTLDTVRMLGLPASQTESETLELLSTLVDCSLISCLTDLHHESRYVMLETIRHFGLWQLQAHDEQDETYRALSGGLATLVDQARKEIGGANQKPWVDRLDAERGNVRAVCEWAIEVNQPDVVLRLGNALWPFWVQRGDLAEGRSLLQRALTSPSVADETLRANAGFNLGILAFEMHDYDSARKAYSDCLEIWERIDDQDGVACAQNGLGLIAREVGMYEEAIVRLQEASEVWQSLDDVSGVAVTQLSLATVALCEGSARKASIHLAEALTLFRQLGDVDRSAYVLYRLGQAACLEARLEDAEKLFRESLDVFTRLGDRGGEASAHYAMACCALLANDEHEALRLFHVALSLRHALASRNGIIEPVEGIAAIAASRSNAAVAARLLAATAAYRTSIGAVPPYAERQRIEATWAVIRARLPTSEIDEARRAGEKMSLDETALDALRLLERPVAATPLDVLEKLSARERDVFVLLSQYKTDREIAERLFLSHRTVERHVGSILEKLEVKNRREAAALGAMRRAS